MKTDYLIIGAGAVGMIFADQLLTETDAHITIVDKRAAPGGHWLNAYPFVRLHQPSAFYGAGSGAVGEDRIDTCGWNAGLYAMASGVEIRAYFDALMQERFLPSGRVTYLPECEWRDGRVVSLREGAVTHVRARRKIVDARYSEITTPSTHERPFEVADGVRVMAPNDLPNAAVAQPVCVIGGGKTAMDAIVRLLQIGTRAEMIRWICPRDSWVINRASVQPGDDFLLRFVGGQVAELVAAAEASSIEDLFARLEAAGQLLRVDRNVRPTMYRGATSSEREVEMIRAVRDVVRMGRVLRIEREAIVLDGGGVSANADTLYVDCTAHGTSSNPSVPVFQGNTIIPQIVRGNIISYSTALIAHVEAAYDDDVTKNKLCPPIMASNTDVDWLRLFLHDLQAMAVWAGDKELRRWGAGHRLSGFGTGRAEGVDALRLKMRDLRPRAGMNLMRLLGGA